MARRHQGGVHAQLNPFRAAPRDGQQPDRIAQLRGRRHVALPQAAQALHVHGVQPHGHAEGVGGQQCELVGGVGAVHVEGRIGLGVAQGLSLGQRGGQVQAARLHAREDVVAGAVEHARQRVDAVGRQALAQRLDDGHAAGHGRLVGQHAAMARGRRGQLLAMLGQQGLVGRHHVLAVGQRGEHPAARGAAAAGQLQHHVHAGIGGQPQGVGQQAHAWRALQYGRRPGGGARGHGDDVDGPPRARRDQRLVAPQHAPHAGAHGADADHAHAQGRGRGRRVGARFGQEAGLGFKEHGFLQTGRKKTQRPGLGFVRRGNETPGGRRCGHLRVR